MVEVHYLISPDWQTLWIWTCSSVIHFRRGGNDDAAGRFLDPVYQTGSMGLFTSCALPAGDAFALDRSCFHFQTTRCRLDGESAREETREDPFRPKHGYSKDHRPDLKPIVLTT